MILVQALKRGFSQRQGSRVAAAFWLGTTAALIGMFLQNRSLLQMAEPLIGELKKCADQLCIPDEVVKPFLSVMRSGGPEGVMNPIQPFLQHACDYLSTNEKQ